MKIFNCQMIHQSLKSFPNLYINFIYSNTYVETHCFDSLECYINKSIQDQDVKQLEFHARYSTSLHCSMCPIVNIIYSTPALNTHSHQRALLQNINPIEAQQDAVEQGVTNDFLHYFTLPNNLDHNSIVRLPMNDTNLYQLQHAGEDVINEWREAKKEKVRKRKEREMRKKAEKMAKLHRLLNRVL